MELRHIELKEANAFVERYHRHHPKVQGHRFSLCAVENGEICGVAIVGRPLSRHLDDGDTLEVLRLCTTGKRNCCSFLYSASANAGKRLGYSKIITYILESELGTSLKASGWELEDDHCGSISWDNSTRTKQRKQFEQMEIFVKKKNVPQVFKKRYAKKL